MMYYATILTNKDPIVMAIMIMIFTVCVAQSLQFYLKRRVSLQSKFISNNLIGLKFLIHLLSAIIYITGFSIAISEIDAFKNVAKSLLAGAGLITVAIGFASQNALSNIISGIFIVIFKPFKLNDRIKLKDGQMGFVEDITLRHTIIKDLENKSIIIPNSLINAETIVNFDFSNENFARTFHYFFKINTPIEKLKIIILEFLENDHRLTQDFVNENIKKNITIVISEINEKGIKVSISIHTRGFADSQKILFDLNEYLLKVCMKQDIQFSVSSDYV